MQVMRRRDLIAGVAVMAAASPLDSRVQTPKRRRIAFLVTGTPLVGQPYVIE